jgi:hypothetical protein
VKWRQENDGAGCALLIGALALSALLAGARATADDLPALVLGKPATACKFDRLLLCVPAPDCAGSPPAPPAAITDAYVVLDKLSSGSWVVIGPSRRTRIRAAAKVFAFLDRGACFVPTIRSTGDAGQQSLDPEPKAR